MKTVVLARVSREDPGRWLPELLVGRPWMERAARAVVQIGIAVPTAPGAPAVPPVLDAVIELWSDAPLAGAIAADEALASCALDIRQSEEIVAKDEGGPRGLGVTPGLTQLSFIAPIAGMPRAETLRHWSEHIPLALEIHVGMNRYVQDRLSAGGPGASPWFGMAHLHFPDEAALRDGLFRTVRDVETITADVAEFVDGYATMLAIEHVLKA